MKSGLRFGDTTETDSLVFAQGDKPSIAEPGLESLHRSYWYTSPGNDESKNLMLLLNSFRFSSTLSQLNDQKS